MAKDKDYRNTSDCPPFSHIEEKKARLEEKIKSDSPRTKIIYNKVRERKGPYHEEFANIYNKKCAYCGAMWGLLPVEVFEVDHFINEASFPDTIKGKVEAGKMKNLVWACSKCNRGKSGLEIMPPYDEILNVDSGNIACVFLRDKMYNIRISDTYESDQFVQDFYKKLGLGHEVRRLDYLALGLYHKYQDEKDEKRKKKLAEALALLMLRRNYIK